MQWTIVGLGNFGAEYDHTRHNVGRDVVDTFARDMQISFVPKRTHNALIAGGEIDGKAMQLVLPELYMNESGNALKKLIKNLDLAAQLIVIHDDIDLPLGTWKIAWARGAGGHNGLKSVMETLKTKAFLRIRVGVAPVIDGITTKPKGQQNVSNFVLGKFRPEEKMIIMKVTNEIVAALPEIITLGKTKAMDKWNTKGSPNVAVSR